jgi:glycosyltransferase involved in cell wall biosynthesis/ubiquinone/menaquinone biosynthesis C-methylase UbiE
MPCYNEASTLREIVERVLRSSYTGELVIVDDGSTDETLSIARSIDDPRVLVIAQAENQGKGAALRVGFRAVTRPLVIVQDADLEYDPVDYEQMVMPLLLGDADVVYGSRFANGGARRVLYYWHAVGNRFLTLFSNVWTNLNLTDMETCYKAFRREVVQSFEIEEDRFGFEPEITAKVVRGGWRVYEVGISYAGRTYQEGKKIGWRDGFRALYCIVRYSGIVERTVRRRRQLLPPARFDDADVELAAALDNLDGASNYAAWVIDLIRPWLRGDVLEVGAGHGTITDAMVPHADAVVASDLSPRAVERLRERYADLSEVEVVQGDIRTTVAGRTFDVAVLVNVLEHVEDDVEALTILRGSLREGGHVILWVPAFEVLYSRFDRRIGHHRRYTKPDIVRVAHQAGLEVTSMRYVNMVGALAWWILAKQLRITPTGSTLVKAYDRALVPVLRRVEERMRPTFGQSLLCILSAPPGDAVRRAS